ncbi:MAG: hypothetical protein P8017_18500 [Deltaproteobacteria bacterium]
MSRKKEIYPLNPKNLKYFWQGRGIDFAASRLIPGQVRTSSTATGCRLHAGVHSEALFLDCHLAVVILLFLRPRDGTGHPDTRRDDLSSLVLLALGQFLCQLKSVDTPEQEYFASKAAVWSSGSKDPSPFERFQIGV